MKRIILSITALLIGIISFAQTESNDRVSVPVGFNYKALITDNGNALANQSVTLRFTVLENGTTSVYQETQTATTDANGIVSTNIGEGTVVSGVFNTINWAHKQSLKVEIDGGSGFQNFGTNPLKRVPTAKYAEKAGNVFSGDYTDLTNKPNVFRLQGATNPATSYSDDIEHGGDVFIGSPFTTLGVGTTSLRISRRNNNEASHGLVAEVGGSGTEEHFGGFFCLTDDGNGSQFASFNAIENTGNGQHYGSYSVLVGSGSGDHYGSYNKLFGTGTGKQYGVNTEIVNSGDASHYGSYSTLSGSGSGHHFGAYNNLDGTGTGNQFGVRNYIHNSGNGSHYGVASKLDGTGSGDKYGTYAEIPATAGGTHYAIYGKAKKVGSYAGYFDGDVRMTKKLKANDSGNADMKAYVYGLINAAGNKVPEACSDGFSVNKTGTGIYEITFSHPMASIDAYTAIATPYSTFGFVTVLHVNSSKMIIYTSDTAGTLIDRYFNFVVYKK